MLANFAKASLASDPSPVTFGAIVRAGPAAGSGAGGACSGTGGGCSIGMGGAEAPYTFGTEVLEEKLVVGGWVDGVCANDDVPSEEVADIGWLAIGGGGAKGSAGATGAGPGIVETGGAPPKVGPGSVCCMAYGV